MKQQIRDVVLPDSKVDTDVESSLRKDLFPGDDVEETGDTSLDNVVTDDVKTGSVGSWAGPLGEKKFGVKSSRFGMMPAGLPIDSQVWTLDQEVTNYTYEQRSNQIYLVFRNILLIRG